MSNIKVNIFQSACFVLVSWGITHEYHAPPPHLIYKPPPSFGIIALHGLMDFTPMFQEPTVEFKAYRTIHVNVGGGGGPSCGKTNALDLGSLSTKQ